MVSPGAHGHGDAGSLQSPGTSQTPLAEPQAAATDALGPLGGVDLAALENTLKEKEREIYREIMSNMNLSDEQIAALPSGPREQYVAQREEYRRAHHHGTREPVITALAPGSTATTTSEAPGCIGPSTTRTPGQAPSPTHSRPASPPG